jgi:PAS domain S-box-containing protein
MAKMKILQTIDKYLEQTVREWQRQTDTGEDITPVLEHCRESFTSAVNTALPQLKTYKNIFLQAKNPTCILSPRGEIKQCNPAHESLYSDTTFVRPGDSIAQLIGQPLFDRLLDCIAAEKPFQHEMELIKNNGSRLHVDIYASGIISDEGPISVIILISRDQTQRRESDQKLKQFKQMIDHSNDAFYAIDIETGRFVDVNATACKTLGYVRDEILELRIGDICPLLKNAQEWQQQKEWLQSKKRSLFETIHQTRDGELFPVEIGIDLGNSNGSSLFLLVARDISERKAAEKRDQQSSLRWKQMLDSIPDIVTIQGLDNRITQCNQATLKAFATPRAEIIGKHCYELFIGSQEPCDNCPVQLKAPFSPYNEEIFNPSLGCTLVINVSPIFDDTGKLVGVTHFAKDISEQKQLEDQLRHIQKMDSLGLFAGGIAHDFNNILGAIIGYAQLAKTQTPRDARSQEALEQVIIGGQRAAALVEQILTFSRKAEFKLEEVFLQKIIAEVLKLIQPSIPEEVTVTLDIEADCPPLMADSGQVHQMIMNLCTNAYHALREQGSGTLEVSLHQVLLSRPIKQVPAGLFLLLRVKDSGSGIDQALIDRIFEPYFTTKKHGEGTGLGLAVVHGIVRDYNGHILVDSEPGQGTCFNIYLPPSPN